MKNLSAEKFLLLKQNPSAKAIISSSAVYTYDQLRQKVLSASFYFKNQNISSGDRVGIFSKNNMDFVINILALWQISAIPVPINFRLNESEIKEQFDSARCSLLLAHQDLYESVKHITKKTIQFPFENKSDEFLTGPEEIKLIDPAVIIFTSGSTNKSKGIILSFNSLYQSAINSNQLLRYTRSDSWLATLPFYHVGGLSIITRSLLFGIPLILPDSLSVGEIKYSLSEWHPTFISLVAAQLKKFVDEGVSPNAELKNCLLGGGFSDMELILKAYDLEWPINIVYGSTETASFVTALLKEEIIIKSNSVGRAIPTNRIEITDDDGNKLKPFEIGEITVQSNALMTGYLDGNQMNQVITNGYYHTGDIGYVDEEGYLFIVGRKNYLISTGGENVNPTEVEKALLDHPKISEAAVFPLKDEEWGEIVAASVVSNQKSEKLSFEDIIDFLQKKISSYKIPKKIFFEDDIPKSELGKIQKEKLIARYKLTSL